MLMSNSPLPDFLIQFADNTRLRYSLQSSQLLIDKKRTHNSDAIRWEGVINVDEGGGSFIDVDIDGNNISRNSGGNHVARRVDCMPSELREYARISQKALEVCMMENNNHYNNIRDGNGDFKSSLPVVVVLYD
jgi:hypothetical protein